MRSKKKSEGYTKWKFVRMYNGIDKFVNFLSDHKTWQATLGIQFFLDFKVNLHYFKV
jgi:hypothetical protein